MRLYIPCNDLPHNTNHLCVCSESRDVFGQPSASYWSYGNIYTLEIPKPGMNVLSIISPSCHSCGGMVVMREALLALKYVFYFPRWGAKYILMSLSSSEKALIAVLVPRPTLFQLYTINRVGLGTACSSSLTSSMGYIPIIKPSKILSCEKCRG